MGGGSGWTRAGLGNSLFEDNAEFGLGFRLSLDRQHTAAQDLLGRLAPRVGEELVTRILGARQKDAADIADQHERVDELRSRLARFTDTPDGSSRSPSIWFGDPCGSVVAMGGPMTSGTEGSAHVLASGANVKVLVLDTEVYSNTGGQCSKATPRGAVAKFASGGKRMGKKDLGLMAMTYGHVYVASVALRRPRRTHAQGAGRGRESRSTPSSSPTAIVSLMASPCRPPFTTRRRWCSPGNGCCTGTTRIGRSEANPLQLDSAEPKKTPVGEFLASENRFQALARLHPEDARRFAGEAQHDADVRWALYRYLASRPGATAAADIATLVK